MRNYLIFNGGIPQSAIIEDPKGFNTQASIFRCKYIYQENNVIIVSQGFHNLRALFMARNEGMNAYAFDAQDVNSNESFIGIMHVNFSTCKSCRSLCIQYLS